MLEHTRKSLIEADKMLREWNEWIKKKFPYKEYSFEKESDETFTIKYFVNILDLFFEHIDGICNMEDKILEYYEKKEQNLYDKINKIEPIPPGIKQKELGIKNKVESYE